ncbi:unnamed protein product, partial [Amoebophrya sp. A25]
TLGRGCVIFLLANMISGVNSYRPRALQQGLSSAAFVDGTINEILERKENFFG